MRFSNQRIALARLAPVAQEPNSRLFDPSRCSQVISYQPGELKQMNRSRVDDGTCVDNVDWLSRY